jgi:hypothetical protein
VVGNITNTTDSPALVGACDIEATYDTSPGSSGVIETGNVICPINTSNTTDSYSTYTSNVILGGTQTVPTGNTDRRSTGANYFVGAPTASELANGIDVSQFRPVTDTASSVATSLAVQTLGAGGRAPTTWQAGALEKSILTSIVV